ncbi:PREDICTED: ankyrin repeat domain-containing protein 24 [Corvus brachyrhynchos]|uniref:ankyrin repeat domain-containing protein 24 n=1 Tax=Corvus brachyrhynchos TaxID=85066 RepID=UPI0008164667|nr:PREDICTED: ankyrin repeat domain-containing protein 24 [Corvus brachyrhynchos]
MKSLKARFKKADSQDWTKNDEKLLQAVDYNDAGRVTSLLLRKGLVPTKLDSEGKSAFHLAATRGNVDCLEAMLAHGVDAMTKDSSGYTALHLASKHGHPQCVSKLLQASCPVDVADGSGRTALHLAAASGCISCSEILCDFKAPLNSKDKVRSLCSWSCCARVGLSRSAAQRGRDTPGLPVTVTGGLSPSGQGWDRLGRMCSLLPGVWGCLCLCCSQPRCPCTHLSSEPLNLPNFLSLLLCPIEEESTEQTSQTSSPSQSSVREKSSTPRKRKAPLPPLGTPSQEDRDAYEEIVRLRQERAQFLQKIRGLEQQEKQRRERAELDESSLRSMEKQIRELEERLAVRDGEKEKLGKEVEALRSRLSSMENEKENTSYDIETLQDEEGDPLEFPGAELLLSKKTLSPSAEELLATLQGQVQSLTVQNKELREKIQVLENYERDESSPPAPGDVVPASLYRALPREREPSTVPGRSKPRPTRSWTLQGWGSHSVSEHPVTLCPVQITELSKEVFRLKEALNALPESGGPPQSPPNTAALQARIRALEEKLEETETRHSKVVTLYRSHLLYAVQGHMDEDVQRLLCQILRMQQLQEQGR